MQYLQDLECPVQAASSNENRQAVLEWLLSFAIGLEYADHGEVDVDCAIEQQQTVACICPTRCNVALMTAVDDARSMHSFARQHNIARQHSFARQQVARLNPALLLITASVMLPCVHVWMNACSQ